MQQTKYIVYSKSVEEKLSPTFLWRVVVLLFTYLELDISPGFISDNSICLPTFAAVYGNTTELRVLTIKVSLSFNTDA